MSATPTATNVLIFGLLLLCLVGPVQAEDSLEPARLPSQQTTLRWDNIEGAPYWLSGPQPRYDRAQGMHLVTLKPAETLQLWLPESTQLRLYHPAGRVSSEALSVAISNGSGLYYYPSPQQDQQGRNLLFTTSGASLVQLQAHSTVLRLALFVARIEPPVSLAAYRDLIELPATAVRVQPQYRESERFWPLNPQHPIHLRLQGPRRVIVRYRTRLSAELDTIVQPVQLDINLQGQLWQTIDRVAVVQQNRAVRLDDCIQAVSREDFFYLDIPDGSQQLSLHTSTPLLIRLQTLAEPDDYLLPALNAPAAATTDPRASLFLPIQLESLWNIADDALERQLHGPDFTARLLAVQRLIRDNRYRDGRLLAANMLDRLATEQPPLAAELNRLAAVTRSRYGFWRALTPSQLPAPARPVQAWAELPGSLAADQTAAVRVLPPLSPLLRDRLPDRMTFFTLPADTTFSYTLPAMRPASQLQLLIAAPDITSPIELQMQFADAPLLRLRLSDGAQTGALPRFPSLSRIVLNSPAATLGMNTAQLLSAPVVQTAHATFDLPSQVQQIRLSGATQSVAVALRYRADADHKLGEHAWLDLQARLPSAARQQLHWLPVDQTKPELQTGWDAVLQRELANQQEPLLRFLRSRATAWRTDTIAQSARLAGTDLAGTVQQLRAQGLHYLAEQYLRAAFLYGDSNALRQFAYEQLHALYSAHDESFALEGLLSAALQRDGSLAAQTELVQRLNEADRAYWAILLAQAMPLAQQPLDSLLQASYNLGWWSLFNSTLERLDDPQEQSHWRGLQAQLQGDYEAARQFWTAAGKRSKAWLTALERGLAISARLPVNLHTPTVRDNSILDDWAQWWTTQPGPYNWQDAAELATGYAGGALLYAPELDAYSHYFRANRKQTLELQVQGPVRLRLDSRLLYPTAPAAAVDDWLLIETGSTSLRSPVNADRPAAGLQLAGSATELPGRLHSVELSIPAGFHKLHLYARDHAALFQIKAWRPRYPLHVLPLPGPASYLALTVRSDKSDHTRPALQAPSLFTLQQCRLQPVSLAAPRRHNTALLETLSHTSPHISQSSGKPAAVKLADPILSQASRWLWADTSQPEATAPDPAAELFFQQHRDNPALEPLRRRLLRNTRWLYLDNIASSAGIRAVELPDGWQPESPELALRQALLPPLQAHERRLSGAQSLTLTLFNPVASRLSITLQLEDLLDTASPLPGQMFYQLDQQARQTVQLRVGQTRQLTLTLPAGEHYLQLGLQQSYSNRFLRLGLADSASLPEADVLQHDQRWFHIARHDQPLSLFLQGPAWLRIDSYQDGAVQSQYRQLGPGWQQFDLTPPAGRPEALYRVYQRVYQEALERSPPSLPRPAGSTPAPVTAPPVTRTEPAAPATQISLDDRFRLGQQEDGTWSFGAALVRRRNLDDEPGTAAAAERFSEFAASYRYFDPVRTVWYHSALAARLRQDGDPTLVARNRIAFYVRPSARWTPVSVLLRGDVFAQRPTTDADLEWSAYLSASAVQNFTIGPRTDHFLRAEVFIRPLSLDDNPYPGDILDQDVFSRYKADHRYGLRLSDSWRHRPWLDTEWGASLGLSTNEDFNPLQPDYLQARLTWRQLLGDWQADLSYRVRRYFDDDDRRNASTEQRLYLTLDWDYWTRRQQRWQLGFDWNYDLEENSSNWLLQLQWHGGEGRGLRDFRPGEIDFDTIRKYRARQADNNRITPVFDEAAVETR